MKRILIKQEDLMILIYRAKRIAVRVDYRHDDFCEAEISKTQARIMFGDLEPDLLIRVCYYSHVLRIG